MMPTLHDSDIVLVDLGRRAPTPPGIFVLHDGMGLVAKRLEHIPKAIPSTWAHHLRQSALQAGERALRHLLVELRVSGGLAIV